MKRIENIQSKTLTRRECFKRFPEIVTNMYDRRL